MIKIREIPDLSGQLLPSWLSSAILQMIVMMVLALISVGAKSEEINLAIFASTDEEELLEELPEDIPIELPPDIPIETTTFDAIIDVQPDAPLIVEPDDVLPGDPDLIPGLFEIGKSDLTTRIGDGGGDDGTGLIGRAKRYTRIKGTPERAVGFFLGWSDLQSDACAGVLS